MTLEFVFSTDMCIVHKTYISNCLLSTTAWMPTQFKFNMTMAVALISPVHSYSHIQHSSLSLFFLFAKAENLGIIPSSFSQYPNEICVLLIPQSH